MKFLNTLSNKKSIILLLAFMIVGIILIFTQYFGLFPLDDAYALDMLNYYSKTQFFNNLESMDQASRRSYFMIHVGDYIFMFGFYQLLGVCIYKLLKNKSKLLYLVIIPYLAFLFDFIENFLMDTHLLIYPRQVEIFGYIAGISTFMKFTTLYLSIIIIIFIAVYKYIIKLRKV